MKRRCNECLFSKNKIVSDQRKTEILRRCHTKKKHFVCHKASIEHRDIECRGFFDTQDKRINKLLADNGLIEFVMPPN